MRFRRASVAERDVRDLFGANQIRDRLQLERAAALHGDLGRAIDAATNRLETETYGR